MRPCLTSEPPFDIAHFAKFFGLILIWLATALAVTWITRASAAEVDLYAPGEAKSNAGTHRIGRYTATYGEDWRADGGNCVLMEVRRGRNVVFIIYSNTKLPSIDNTKTQADFDAVLQLLQRVPPKACAELKAPAEDAPR